MLCKFLSRKRKGNAELIRATMLVFYSIVLVMIGVSMKYTKVLKNNIDDTIVSSGLAATLVDQDTYSSEEKLYINKYDSLRVFENCMKANLGINEFVDDAIDIDTVDFGNRLVGDKARVIEYRIYNVFNGTPDKVVPSDDPKLQPIVLAEEKGAEIVKCVYKDGTWKSDAIVASTPDYIEDYHISYYENDLDETIDQTSIYVELEIPIKTLHGQIKGIIRQKKLFSVDKVL